MDVVNNEAESRYELELPEGLALAAYRRHGDTISFTHTEVPESLQGRGIGGRLVEGALADVRKRRLKVIPLCPFVEHYIATHPGTQDLLASP